MRRSDSSTGPALRGLKLVLRVLFFALLVGLVVLILSEGISFSDLLGGRQTSAAPTIGLVAGHWQSDSGAVCPDGLQEVDLNLQIARGVADRLRTAGYTVEVLPEYSPRLNGYRADLLLSIHNDSCTVQLSGYKIAGTDRSSIPEATGDLVALLNDAYAEATGLELHLNTITDDMLEYHAWRQIDAGTPAAIIECGFMGGDRALLTDQQERVVKGIVNGLIAYLTRSETTPAP
ncbi:MAG: N-acetylmuramoyl-L-alanine amidase [Chloroflexi bacterium]|jgi:N-acetylmuramoyl-L-alanine amidase|nr:N-acetylmuramoyl-L-alanine amidase [Chloroflexota bacterium]